MPSEKIIRDPVHDVICFQTDHPLDRLLLELISCPEMQRLRRIRQLGMAHMAYPGADHSRYSHSIGVMETARKVLARLHPSHDDDRTPEVLCAALLHDIGHGPFSHVFERVTRVHHETAGARLILDGRTHVHRLLTAFDPGLPQKVVDLLRGQAPADWRHDLLSSQLDADRFDYLLRDNLMTGSRYGDFDLMWLIHHLVIQPGTQRLAVTWKGSSAVEAYLQSRYHMYRHVYFHKVVRAAEGMLRLALARARRLAIQDRLPWPPPDHSARKALLGQELSPDEFCDFDDVSILHCFKEWRQGPDAVLARLCQGLLFREIYKTLDLSHIAGSAEAQQVYQRVRHAVINAGGDAEGYDLFYDEVEDTPYHSEDEVAGHGREILIQQPDGGLRPFRHISGIPALLSRQVMFRRIHVRQPLLDVARAAAE